MMADFTVGDFRHGVSRVEEKLRAQGSVAAA